MEKTKAAFKALREEVGLSQLDVAEKAGVSLSSVKKWENPKYDNPLPDDVWGFLLECRGAMYEDAREIAEDIIESMRTIEGAHDLTLDYYRTQADLNSVQAGSGACEPVGYVNARMRAVAHLLDKAEIPYTYEYRSNI